MQFKTLLALTALLPSVVFADWLPVGKVGYHWGPFHIYDVSLATETGKYEPNQRPLMLSFQYKKSVEGKNFAITLMKEIDSLGYKNIDKNQLVKTLQKDLPDLTPNDILHYIALSDRGYFVFNDTILPTEFLGDINNAIVDVWLSPKSQYLTEQKQLINGEAKTDNSSVTNNPETAPIEEENADPQVLPKEMIKEHS